MTPSTLLRFFCLCVLLWVGRLFRINCTPGLCSPPSVCERRTSRNLYLLALVYSRKLPSWWNPGFGVFTRINCTVAVGVAVVVVVVLVHHMFLLLMTNRRLSLAMTPRYGFRFTSVARRVWETQKEGAKVFAPSRERGNISNPEHHRLKSAVFGGHMWSFPGG